MSKVSLSKSDLIINKLSQLKSNISYNVVLGNYEGYKNSLYEYSRFAVDNFEYVSKAKAPKIQKVPLFSKIGFNILKIGFLNLFRKKSPEEKLLKKMSLEYKAKKASGIEV